ncbi:MAG: nucleotide exchange factor GrpE [Kaiparowitsia implicata GSE-PSE-MK54-09C]|jgi:molecular chaperone GrpE|nr:nucleotide exchange factor GrpE [Kaiparowitsia implicata GSE-PSE-MK54-09C]
MVNEDKQVDGIQDQASNAPEPTTSPEVGDAAQTDVAADGVNPEVDAQVVGDRPSDAAPAGAPANAGAVEELNQQLTALKAQLEDRNSQFMRMAADFDNFRKRTQKEKEDLELQIKCSTVVEILPVVDNFERARSQLKPQSEEAIAIHKSYQGVYKDLVDRLKRIGVAQMRSEGKEFDPTMHEAVMREASAEFPEGAVIEELVRGYMLGERVLRHAMVKVASAPEESLDLADDQNSAEPEA